MKSFLQFLILTFGLAFVAQQAAAQSFSIDFKDSPNTGFDSNLAPKVAPLNSGTTLGQQRQIAFQYALNQLLGRFQLSRTIVIRARFAELSDSTVAQARPVSQLKDWWSSQSAFVSGVLYPVALANQLAGRDLTTFGFDLEDMDITFDYEVAPRAFYYGLDGNPGSAEIDFVHTAMHEIGHCLGFTSNADENGNWANSFFGLGGDPTIWDHFLQSNGVRLREMTSAQRAAAVVGDRVQFVGANALAMAASDPIWVHSPTGNGYKPGSSMHHLDEAAFNGTLFFSGLFNETRNRALSEMMSPIISKATHSLGPIGWAVLQDLGWTLKDNSGPEVRILSPDSGSRKEIDEITGDITDAPDASAVGAWKLEGGLFNKTMNKWLDWVNPGFSGDTYNGGSHARVFFPEIMPRATGTRRWTFVMPNNLPEGSYRVALKGIDQLGREGEWVYRDFTLDRTAPLLTFSRPAGEMESLEGLEFTAPGAASVEVAFRRPNQSWLNHGWATTDDYNYQLTHLIAGSTTWDLTDVDYPGPESISSIDGGQTIWIRVRDSAGNQVIYYYNFRLPPPDTTPPTVAFTGLDTFMEDTTPWPGNYVSIEASDNKGPVQNVVLFIRRSSDNLYWNGTGWGGVNGAGISTDPTTGSPYWNADGTKLPRGTLVPSQGLASGTYVFIAIATDGVGLTTQTDLTVTMAYSPTNSWTGLASNDWDDPLNWSSFQVPGSTSKVKINGTVNVTGSRTVRKIEMLGGTLTTSGLLLTFLDLRGGDILGGAITMNGATGGTWRWYGGRIKGSITVQSGATLTMLGNDPKWLLANSSLTNSGYMEWSGSPIVGEQDTTITNGPGNVFVVLASGPMLEDWFGGNRFINQGTILRRGTGVTDLGPWLFRNHGTLYADEASFAFPSTLELQTGTLLRTLNGQILLTGETTAYDNFATEGDGVRFTVGTLEAVVGGLTAGTIHWEGGEIKNRFEVKSGASLELSGPDSKWLGTTATLINRGMVKVSGTGAWVAYSNCLVDNRDGAVVELSGSGGLTNWFGGNVLRNNQGATVRRIGAGVTEVEWAVNNQSFVDTKSGTLRLVGGGTSVSGTWRGDAGAVTEFAGGNHLLSGSSLWEGACTHRVSADVVLGENLLINGHLHVSGGELLSGSPGAVTLQGTAQWTGGTIGGKFETKLGSTWYIEGDDVKWLGQDAVVDHHGSAIFRNNGELRGYGNVTFRNHANASFLMLDEADFTDWLTGNIFINLGNGILRRASAGTTILPWEFNNNGRCEILAGALVLRGGGTGNGQFRSESGARTEFQDQGFTMMAGTQWSGEGRTEIDGALVHVTGNTTITGELRMESGEMRSEGGATITMSGAVEWTGGTLGGNLLYIATSDVMDINPGNEGNRLLGQPALLTNRGAIYLNAPLHGSQATLQNDPEGKLFFGDIDPFDDWFGNNLLINAGQVRKNSGGGTAHLNDWTIRNTGGDLGTGSGALEISTNLDLKEGGRLVGPGTLRFHDSVVTAHGTTTVTDGILTLGLGTLASHADGPGSLAGAVVWAGSEITGPFTFAAPGTVDFAGGRINGVLHNDGVFTMRPDASMVGSGATLENQGTIRIGSGATFMDWLTGNTIRNAGILELGDPYASLQSEWAFEQTLTGELRMELGGVGPGTQRDNLAFASTASLGGTLRVVLTNGYVPPPAASIELLAAGSLTGRFASIIAGGVTVSYSATSVLIGPGNGGVTFGTWASLQGLNGLEALPGADPDGDGYSNFAEYVFAGNPVAGTALPQSTGVANLNGQNWLVLRYRRWADRELTGVVYSPESSNGLGSWSPTGVIDEVDPEAQVIPGSTACRCRIMITPGAGKFLRVKATQP